MFAKRQKSSPIGSSSLRWPLRWYLFLWMCLIYVWGVLGEMAIVHTSRSCLAGSCAAVLITNNPFSIATLPEFTLLICLLCLLFWLGMSGSRPAWWYWTCFLAQGGLVLAISLLPEQQIYVALSLYLACILEVLAVFQRARPVLPLAGYYCLLFFVPLFPGALLVKMQVNPLFNSAWLASLLGISANYLALFLFAAGYLVIYVQQLRSHRQLEKAHRELLASAAQIQDLTLLTERQRMARELHDTLVQNLAGLIRQLDVAASLLAHQRTERAQSIIQESSAYARAALVEARCAIGDLRVALPGPSALLRAVQEEIERFTIATGIACQVQLEALSSLQPPLYEHTLRAISEGLTNVARHAQARRAWVRTAIHARMLTIEVGDDGIGFSPTFINQAGHYGLLGLRERTRLAHGQFDLQSEPGKGTVLLLQFSLQAEEL